MSKNIARTLLVVVAAFGIVALASIPIYIAWLWLSSLWKAVALYIAIVAGIAGLFAVVAWAIDRVDWD